jgi:hypothetical protein
MHLQYERLAQEAGVHWMDRPMVRARAPYVDSSTGVHWIPYVDS